MTTAAELGAVPGVPEARLDDATMAALTAEAPGAPWECDCVAVVWWGRGGGVTRSSARGVVPGRGHPLVVVGAMISYQRTPVGQYHEVLGAVGTRHGRGIELSIPFIAVDSPDSLVAGRQNWSLPKVLAQFTGEPGPRTSLTAARDGWTVRATARPIGPAVAVPMRGRLAQRWPDGVVRTAVLSGRGRSRLALVTVATESSGDLPRWLRPGRHLGAIISNVTFTLPAVVCPSKSAATRKLAGGLGSAVGRRFLSGFGLACARPGGCPQHRPIRSNGVVRLI